VLTRAGRLDELTVRVERRTGAEPGAGIEAGAALRTLIKNTIGVTVGVEVGAPDTIERSMGKMRRVIDERER
jgi:phenylacetate-CoA ligase